jgi:hypothetical protein
MERRLLFTCFMNSPNHHFGGVEVGYYAILQGTYRFDAGIAALMHPLCLFAYCYALACIIVYSYDAWFIQQNILILIDDCISCTKVDCELLI